MKHLLLAISLFNFGSYMWSVIGIFKKTDTKASLQYRLLQVNSIAVWVLLTRAMWQGELTPELYALNIVIQIFCAFAFWKHSQIVKQNNFSIVFSKDAPSKLVRQGFYKRVRHPFYMIYLITYFSLALSFAEPFALSACVCLFVLYFLAARFEEAKFAQTPFRDDYAAYIRDAGMFYPKFW